MDSSPIILDKADSGRGCPSARAVWTEDTLRVVDQCIQLPGEVSTLVLDYVRLACSSRGCAALNQLQRVIRVDGPADSIVELLVLRLDEQGTEASRRLGLKSLADLFSMFCGHRSRKRGEPSRSGKVVQN